MLHGHQDMLDSDSAFQACLEGQSGKTIGGRMFPHRLLERRPGEAVILLAIAAVTEIDAMRALGLLYPLTRPKTCYFHPNPIKPV
jgi:hypothetical protein